MSIYDSGSGYLGPIWAKEKSVERQQIAHLGIGTSSENARLTILMYDNITSGGFVMADADGDVHYIFSTVAPDDALYIYTGSNQGDVAFGITPTGSFLLAGATKIGNYENLPFTHPRLELDVDGQYRNTDVVQLPDQVTTPFVTGSNVFITSNSVSTTITNLIHPYGVLWAYYKSLKITILATTGYTTMSHGASIVLNGATDWAMDPGDTITLVSYAQKWYETGRSDNS
jgi:hypothetical protein